MLPIAARRLVLLAKLLLDPHARLRIAVVGSVCQPGMPLSIPAFRSVVLLDAGAHPAGLADIDDRPRTGSIAAKNCIHTSLIAKCRGLRERPIELVVADLYCRTGFPFRR